MTIAKPLSFKAAVLFSIVGFFLVNCPANACSMPANYKGPETNFDLVQQADTILVGTLLKSSGDNQFDRKILVKPTLLLKGRNLPETVYIQGYLSDRTYQTNGKKYRLRIKKSEPLDLWRPHPEVWMGGCRRQGFERGSQLLLFFKDRNGHLEWFSPPFTRSSEDVAGPNALWVRAVKIYARVVKLPLATQRAALTNEMDALRKKTLIGHDEFSLLADDIERILANVGPVAGFDAELDSDKAREWASNIVEQMYFYVPPPLEVKQSHDDIDSWLWISLGLLVASITAVCWVLMKKRKAMRP